MEVWPFTISVLTPHGVLLKMLQSDWLRHSLSIPSVISEKGIGRRNFLLQNSTTMK